MGLNIISNCGRILKGEEASFICLVSGNEIIPLASSKDHKKLNNGDYGPNTGGMGAYSPTKLIDKKMTDIVIEQVISPTLNELKKQGGSMGIFICWSDRQKPKTLCSRI